MERSWELADALPKIGAIKFGVFEMKSRLKSPIYVDLRLLQSFPDLLSDCAGTYWEMTKNCMAFDLIAGVPYAAIPFVAATSVLYDIPMITPREPKAHGTKAAIDGVYQEGRRVVLMDDLVTTAGSKLTAIQTLESAGLVVVDVCVLVDREQGGKEELEKAGYNLHSAWLLRNLLDRYLSKCLVSVEQYNIAMEYLDDPMSYMDNAMIKM